MKIQKIDVKLGYNKINVIEYENFKYNGCYPFKDITKLAKEKMNIKNEVFRCTFFYKKNQLKLGIKF